MHWEDAFSDLIIKKYEQAQRKNPRYSLRSYATSLDVSVGALSELLRKKRHLSIKRTLEVLDRIAVSPQEKNRILTLMGLPVQLERAEISESQHRLVSDILCSAFLAYLDLSEVDKTPDGAAHHFAMDPEKAAEIFSYLSGEKLIVEEKGQYKSNPNFIRTSDGVPSTVLRARHEMNLELARASVESIDLAERDITASSFAGSRAQMELLRKEIRLLHAKASAVMEVSPKDEIYQLVVAVHPINRKLV